MNTKKIKLIRGLCKELGIPKEEMKIIEKFCKRRPHLKRADILQLLLSLEEV